MLNRLVIRTLSLLFVASSLFAAGSVSQSLQQLGGPSGKSWALVFHWTGDSINGSVPATKAQIGSQGILQGYFLTSVETVPKTPAPTASYGITITDQAGVDVLGGNAASLSATLPQAFSASLALPPINGTFTLNITGTTVAGAKGDVYVYMTDPLALVGAGPAGSNGAAGSAGANGLSILNGSGVPSSGLGVNGDFYLDTAASRLYGPKSGGVWGSGVSLIGATGSAGAAGTAGLTILNGSGAPSSGLGVNGDFYIDTAGNAIYGPKSAGAWGSGTSLIGPTGPAGTFPVVLGPLQFLQGTPNVSVTSYKASDLPYFLVSDFDFPAVTPGGSLTGGVLASVTLTPCPLGVAGADANHNYYISAGTGTAEPVLGSGGTCTSGASTGTILFTPANNHGGAWTFKSDSGGMREAVLYSGGHATIVLDANRTILTSAASGIVVDKDNLTFVGAGNWTSSVKARDNAAMNQIILSSACNNCKYQNFRLDGNRANGGTNALMTAGTIGVGGANHLKITGMELTLGASAGVVVTDTNKDIDISGNYIHDIGGVTNGAGSGTCVFIYWSNALLAKTDSVRFFNNYVADCHNTISNAGASSGFAAQASNIIVDTNFFINNYNNGGQVVIASGPGPVGPATISNNTIVKQATALTETTSGVESDSYEVTIIGNSFVGHDTGSSVALEGNASSPGGIGALNNIVANNTMLGSGSGIGLNNAVGIVKGTIVTGNRVSISGGGGVGVFSDSATLSTVIGLNNFTSTAIPINDTSTAGAMIYGNFPQSSNLGYGGTVSSAASIAVRCGQTLTVSGVVGITNLVLPSDFAGALGAGCTVTLIPSGVWATSGANFTLGSTAVVGKALIETFNGSKWSGSY